MGIRLIIVLLALGGVGIYWGGTNFVTAVRERDPLEITCANYLKQKPDNRYLKLTECDPDMDNMALYEEGEGTAKKITAVYVPLRAKGTTVGKTQIVLLRKDTAITDLVSRADKLGTADEAQAKRIMDEFEAPNEGLVQFGMDLSDSDQKQLKGLNLGLSDDFVIMERGKEPKLLLGALALGGGLAALAFMLRGVIRRFRGTSA